MVVALALRGPIEDDLFDGSTALYWILVVAVLAYAASYFARGYLAGHRRFALYGGLVLMEATSRCLFALAVAVGIAEGQTAVALGMAAAPIVSLAVVPSALARRLDRAAVGASTGGCADPAQLDAAARDEPAAREPEFTLAHGTGFAAAVLVIMLCEQTFLNAGPLLVKATAAVGRRRARRLRVQRAADRARPAPALPGDADLDPPPPHPRCGPAASATRSARSVNVTLTAIAGFAGVVALVMLVARPDGDGRRSSAATSTTTAAGSCSSRSAWASTCPPRRSTRRCWRTRSARQSATCWAACAVTFVLFLLLADFDDRVLQVEVAFVGAAALLCGLALRAVQPRLTS